jgi:Spy/CpxP family protein refolding chaperone
MKNILLVLTLGAALAVPAFAQSADSTNAPPSGPPPGGFHHDHMSFLTDAEKAELKKAHDAAIAADPSLATEEQSIHEAMQSAHESGTPPSDADKAQWHAFHDKLDAAMIAADPAVAPIIAKIKAHHHGPGASGGTPPPPPPAN